jgi:ubiquinone/menaquinone biosynthesis C-methylase UbiE
VNGEGPLRHLREHRDVIENDVKLLRALLPSGARLLDIGAGRGSFVLEAKHQGWDAVALDIQTEAPAVWRPAGVAGVIGDGSRTPFKERTFEAVRLKEVLEHIQDPLAMVREVGRILRPGGLILAHVPTPQSQLYPVANFWDDYTHVRPMSRYGLTRLMEDGGFQVVSIEGYTSSRHPAQKLLGKVLGRIFPHIYRVAARLPG